MDRPTRPATRLVDALAWALERLDSEEHRYVERYTDCPNGCEFDGDIRTAGPDDCPLCFFGSYEDEEAPHINPYVSDLRTLLFRLGGASPTPDAPDQPEAAGDPLLLADVLREFVAPDQQNYADLRTYHPGTVHEAVLDGHVMIGPDALAAIARAKAQKDLDS